MILCDIKDSQIYGCISEGLKKSISWISSNFTLGLEPGVFEIGRTSSGEAIIGKVETPSLLPREKVSLEAHKRFIDIQLPIKGTEIMGWASAESLKLPRAAYDSEKDIVFYGDSATTLIHVKPGQMAIFFPEDAHAPNIGLGNHRKLIIKVPVE